MFDDRRYRVVTPSPFDPPPPTLRPAAEPSAWGRLFHGVLRPAWAWRVELAAVLIVAAAWRLLAELISRRPATAALLVAAGCVWLVPGLRRRVRWLFHQADVRRGFARACRHAELATVNDRVPRVVAIRPVPAGERLAVRIPPGSSAVGLAEAAERLAVVLNVREVRVTRDLDHAAHATVTVVRRDSLAGGPLPWPWAGVPRCSLWRPIPVGVDEEGRWVTVLLPERNMLAGGEPGAGKSGGLNLLVAAAALDPTVRLVLLDGKMVELACWAGCAERTVGPDVAEAIEVLEELRGELDHRYAVLLANRRRKVTPDLGMPLLVVVVDELAFYVAHPDKRAASEFAVLLRDLVARGRAAGVIVLAATQKPAAEVVPTSLRDLFGFRWAFRCLTPQASDTILGAGWASLGYSAQAIDAASRGVGLLLAEGGEPVRLRACWLDDATLGHVAAQAEQGRAVAEQTRSGELER